MIMCPFQLAVVRGDGAGIDPNQSSCESEHRCLEKVLHCCSWWDVHIVWSVVVSPEPLDAFSYPTRQDFCTHRSPPSRLG